MKIPRTIQFGGDGTGFSEMPLEGPSDPASISPEPCGREGRCEDCNRNYTVWYADNDLWNAVMRSNGHQGREPFLCATCFLIRAEPITEFARVTWPKTPSKRDRKRT